MNDWDKQIFLKNALGEYIFVHNYQNIVDFQYYYNIFQPEYVVFEVAEASISNGYFDFERMKAMDLNPTLETVMNSAAVIAEQTIDSLGSLQVHQGKSLTKISWEATKDDTEHVWLVLDQPYDMQKSSDGAYYEVTVKNDVYNGNKDVVQVIAETPQGILIYH